MERWLNALQGVFKGIYVWFEKMIVVIRDAWDWCLWYSLCHQTLGILVLTSLLITAEVISQAMCRIIIKKVARNTRPKHDKFMNKGYKSLKKRP